MTIAELIDVLNKVENKQMQVGFVYDSRVASRVVHSVYIDDWRDGETLVLCEDGEESYCWANPNYSEETEEQYRDELMKERFSPDYWYLPSLKRQYPDPKELENYILKGVDRDVKYWKQNKEDTEHHITLFVEKGD